MSAARPHRSPYGFMQQAGTMTLLPARAPYSAFRKNCPADRFFCPADWKFSQPDSFHDHYSRSLRPRNRDFFSLNKKNV